VEAAVERIRQLARRRILWLRHARGTSEVDALLENRDSPEAEAAWRATDPTARAVTASFAPASRFVRLQQIFELDARELDVLAACIAPTIDPTIGQLYTLLHDHPARSYPTEQMLARLFDHGLSRTLHSESALVRWELVTAHAVAPGEPEALVCDPLIRDWIVGDHYLDRDLVGRARLVPVLPALANWPVDETATWIASMVSTGKRVRVRVVGSAGSGRRTFAAAVAEKLGLRVIALDADAVPDDEWPQVWARVHRQAYLDGCAVAWSGDPVFARRWPATPSPFPVQFVIAEPHQVPPDVDCIDHVVELPVPLSEERRALWLAALPNAATWPPEELDRLASRRRCTISEIVDIGCRRSSSADEAIGLARERTRHRLGELARCMDSAFTWDDLVVSDDLRRDLGDFLFEARDRNQFWEQTAARRLFPQGTGLFALFSGPPGTGKTMAAQVIAATLGVDLFRIALSSVVSKYVGETSKHLQRVLAEAEAMDCVLLFDEADALFGKRTEINDAHDRFANTDTNYLLQAIEAYRGVAILATNKKANIDPAFLRRLRYVLEFPRPDADQRRRLWTQLVGELAGADRARVLERTIDTLATSVELTGAQIKYAVLAAAFAARQSGEPLALPALLRGLDRELAKEGRSLNERERERLRRA
jgi:hypothetical protein